MILSTEITMKWGGTNKDFYESKGYTFTHFCDEFVVKLEDLNPQSKKLVKCKCDFCGKEIEKMFCKAYGQDKHACSSKECIKKLREYTNIKMYGVPYPLSLKEIQEKGEATMMQRYGCRRALQNPEFVEKERATHKKHFGKEENPEAYKDLQNRLKASRKKNSGYEYALQNPETQKRMQERNLELYGVSHSSQRPEVGEKISKAHKAFSEEKLKEIDQKKRATCLKKYGTEVSSQSDVVKAKASESIKKALTGKKRIQKKSHKEIKTIAKASVFKNQIIICEAVHGIINKPIGNDFIHILVDDIAIEYFGYFQNLKNKYVSYYETMKEKEKLILSKGLKLIYFISLKDKILKKDVISKLIKICKDFLVKGNNAIATINIDTYEILIGNLLLKINEKGDVICMYQIENTIPTQIF